MVWLHGGPGLDHHLLLPLARRLAEERDIWLPDLPGHGISNLPSGRLPGLPRLMDHLERWLGGLPGETAVLGGHSLGAWIVRELLRRGRVAPRAAVLLTPPAAEQMEASPSVSALRRGLARGLESSYGPEGAEGAREALRGLRDHVTRECGGRPPRELLREVERTRIRAPWTYRALLRNLLRRYRAPVRSFDPPCPVLVLGAERDATTPPVQAARVARATTGSELVIVPDVGHYLEKLDDVAREIRVFCHQHEEEP